MPNEQAVATQQAKPSNLQTFMDRFITDERRAHLENSLPAHIDVDRFERNLANALMNNWKLVNTKPDILWREVARSAGLGLFLDPALGEAYLIISRGEAQMRVGYRGLIKLARQSGEITNCYAHEVCANDEIDCHLGDDKKLVHKPDVFSGSETRGPVVGYYAVVKYSSGETDFEPMNREEVEKIRDEKSDAYKAFKANKIQSTPWDDDFDEMAKKTCIRRLMKRVPKSPELHQLQQALAHEDRLDFGVLSAESSADNAPPPRPTAAAQPTLIDVPHKEEQEQEDDTPAAFSADVTDWEGTCVEYDDPDEWAKAMCRALESSPNVDALNSQWQENEVADMLGYFHQAGKSKLVEMLNNTRIGVTADLDKAELEAAKKETAAKEQEVAPPTAEETQEEDGDQNPAGLEMPMNDKNHHNEMKFRRETLKRLGSAKKPESLNAIWMSAVYLMNRFGIPEGGFTWDELERRVQERLKTVGE